MKPADPYPQSPQVPHLPPARPIEGTVIAHCRCRPGCLAPLTTDDRVVAAPSGPALQEHHEGGRR